MKEELINLKKEVDNIAKATKENSDIVKVPFVVYESEMKRKQTLIIILIICWFLTIAGIVIYSCIPDNYSSQEISEVNSIDHSTIRSGN